MILIDALGYIMRLCYTLFNDYGIAIILFTLFSKIILIPLSIWVQNNSIKMVKMQPEINKIKIKYFGDKDLIADEQSLLYKREKYNAFASLIPLFIQIFLLIGLVEVINKPITYIAKLPDENVSKIVEITKQNHPEINSESSSIELTTFNDIKNNKYIEEYKEIISEENIDNISSINMNFLGFDLTWVASIVKEKALLVPLIAGISALLLCIVQNSINVLQSEQSKFNKYGMMVFSVGLSVYLGSFVPAGVALYWVFSNIFAILQQYILNIFINPKKYVNYEELEKTSKELKEMEKANSIKQNKEQRKKEKEDYKKFFSITNKHLVFYS